MDDHRPRIEALDQILELTILLNDDMDAALAEFGLTRSRTHLLWEVRRRGPSTQRALADAMGVSARNITGLVDALVQTGFVTREAHPTDRRASLVTPTDHATTVIESLEEAQRELAQQLFADMSDERFAGLTAGLDGLLTRLRDLIQNAAADGPKPPASRSPS